MEIHLLISGYGGRHTGERRRGQCRQCDLCTSAHPHTQQAAMHSVFRHLPLRSSIDLFGNLCYSSCAVTPDNTGKRQLPAGINQPWTAVTLSSVHRLSFLGPLFEGTNDCRAGTPNKFGRLRDALTQSSGHHDLATLEVTQILTLAHFPRF